MNKHNITKQAVLLVAILTLVLAACAPAAVQQPQQQQFRGEQIAIEIWQRMAQGHSETGSYTTNVLIDYALPSGVAWHMESFPGESYELIVTDDSSSGYQWYLTPEDVIRQRI